jgi:dTDP-4-amino-4,6-dideoxygalactose transaminase
MLRLEPAAFGAPRSAVLKALQAEGVPSSGGYGFSLHQQPMFRNKAFGPFLPKASARLNYGKTSCPNSDRLCQQVIWLEQNSLLGPRTDMDDIAQAFEKVYQNRAPLSDWSRKNASA